jgi:endonuclease YncB( thermonuclease family)
MDNATYANTSDYDNLKGLFAMAKVVKVYDGDTIWVAIDFNNLEQNTSYSPNIKRLKLRLARIDCPELRPKKECLNQAEEKNSAVISKQYVENMLLYEMVYVEIMGKDKYGRHLAEVYFNSTNINTLLIQGGYARSYSSTNQPKLDQAKEI